MDRYAVFGNPIAHSKSPFIHTLFARQTQQTMSYERIEAPLDGFVVALERFFAQGGKGCNVTVPFKEDAYRMAMQLSPRAKLAGAVKTPCAHTCASPGLLSSPPAAKPCGSSLAGVFRSVAAFTLMPPSFKSNNTPAPSPETRLSKTSLRRGPLAMWSRSKNCGSGD